MSLSAARAGLSRSPARVGGAGEPSAARPTPAEAPPAATEADWRRFTGTPPARPTSPKPGGLIGALVELFSTGGSRGPEVPDHPIDEARVGRLIAAAEGAGLVERLGALIQPVPGDRLEAPPVEAPRLGPAGARRVAETSALGADFFHLTSSAGAAAIERDGFKTRTRARQQLAGHGVYMKEHWDEAAQLRVLAGSGRPVVLTVKASVRSVGRVSDVDGFTAVTAQLRALAAEAPGEREEIDLAANEALTQLIAGRLGFDALLVRHRMTTDVVVYDPRRVAVVRG